ncbi:MAG: hypothetical protein EPN91_13095 [Salinibacterium sp.]|nr:MAG: hypothetical protein EPN91_13095 [Salinibacterium sp.]
MNAHQRRIDRRARGIRAPFYAHDRDDGMFIRMEDARTPEEAAQEYAWGYGVEEGESVFVAWGDRPNPDYDREYGQRDDNMPFLLDYGPVEYEVIGFPSLGTFAADGRKEFEVTVRKVKEQPCVG